MRATEGRTLVKIGGGAIASRPNELSRGSRGSRGNPWKLLDPGRGAGVPGKPGDPVEPGKPAELGEPGEPGLRAGEAGDTRRAGGAGD